ncbi:MAG: MFS transporter, partial [Alphaproteobacteria bacterium]|nr:MFS transporter [Alphaproteobacteria bacterium]
MSTRTHPLHFPDFRFFWAARLANVCAMSMVVVVIGWQAYGLARDQGMSINAASLRLGLIGLVQFLPLFLMSPFTGLAADMFDRRRLAQAAQLLDLVMIAGLAGATWAHAISLPMLFAGSAVHGFVRGFVGPAMSSLAPNLVPRHML